ncbi:MAG: SCO family protein [Planctomycetes bacterium]|nr:SCO family protein [Planctomycetota bacterium]
MPKLLLLACLVMCGSCSDEPLEIYDTIGGDFTLTDQFGDEYTLSAHDGKIRILFFGFTHCPDICPTTLAEVSEVYAQLDSEQRQQIEILFASVDPQRDTASLLGDYLSSFKLPVIGLRGTEEELQKITAQYASFYEKVSLDSALGYTVDHSSQTFVIDRQGRIRGWVSYDQPASALLEMLERLL